MSCNPCIPCGQTPVTVPNTESLTSALDNFITSFYGSVVKVFNSDGTVTWTLPCDLDAGLPGNPREPNEGSACYLLRLMESGIVGLKGDTGPQGSTGAAGSTGSPAYTGNLNAFAEPAIGSSVSVQVANADWAAVGEEVYVGTSGYYTVISKIGTILSLRLDVPTGVGGTIAAGQIVTPSGFRGAAGLNGADGFAYQFIFIRAVTQPITPTGNGIPATWFATVPTGTDEIWMSVAKQLDGVTSGVWADAFPAGTGPAGATGATGAKGDKGDTGSTGLAGAKGDKGDTGDAGAAGTNGTNGTNGATGSTGSTGSTGNKFQFIFIKDASTPSTPTGNNIPASWSATVPSGSDPLYVSVVEQTSAGVSLTAWATPIPFSGGGGGSSPTTTKGDMIVRSSTVDTRFPVGADGTAIVADSSQTLGVKYAAVVLGTPGVADNALVRADGTAGTTVQGNAGTAILSDNGELTITGAAATGYRNTITAQADATQGNVWQLNNQHTGGTFKSQFSFLAAGILKWAFGNDSNENGGQDFYFFDAVASSFRLLIKASGFLKLGAYGAGTLVTDGGGNVTADTSVGLPVGSDTQIQYNASGAFGATPDFTWNNSTKALVFNGGFSSTVSTTTQNSLYIYGSGAGDTNYLAFLRARGAIGSPSAVQSGDRLGFYNFAGHNGSSFQGVAAIEVTATQAFSSTYGAAIAFNTITTGGSVNAERMRVSGGGNILIGTTSDSGLSGSGLHVAGNAIVDGSLVVSSHTPSSATDTGTAGTIVWDASFIYICIATNTWKRVAIATW